MNRSHLSAALGYTFTDPALLEAALVHRSYVHEHPDCPYPSNERLEFLGDALLNYIAGAFLYHAFPQRGEGELTMARAALVKTATLALFARRFDLGHHVLMSKGEDRSGARDRDSLLADTFEALLAAIALDSSWEATRDFLLPLLAEEMARIDSGMTPVDAKSTLQEHIQGATGITPSYRECSVQGPDHQREWTMEVWVGDLLLGTGTGSSKQSASQAAASHALAALAGPEPPALPKAEVGR